MRFLPNLLLPAVAVVLNLAVAADLPEGGVALVNESKLLPAQLEVRIGGGVEGSHEVVPSSHDDFVEVLRLRTSAQPPNTWDVGVGAKTTTPVEKGDAILAGFWARGQSLDRSAGAVAEFVFERNGNPHTKSVQHLIETPKNGDWEHFWVRCRSLEDYPIGGAVLNFQVGYQGGRFELGGMEAWNFGQEIDLEKLPHTAITYVGREAEADWRAEAVARIERHRMGPLAITLLDAEGQPLAGTADADRYREILSEHFNLAAIENSLKWKQWDAWPQNQVRTLNALRWLKKESIPARGHVMVWPGHRYLPEWVSELANQENPEALRGVIDGHIREMGYASKGLVRDWDVLNEVFDNRDLTNALGDEEMVKWFQAAKRAIPEAKRYYNDYAALVRGGFPTSHRRRYAFSSRTMHRSTESGFKVISGRW